MAFPTGRTPPSPADRQAVRGGLAERADHGASAPVLAPASARRPATPVLGGGHSAFLVAVRDAADRVSRLVVEPDWSRDRAAAVAEAAASATGAAPILGRAAVCARVLADPLLLRLPPRVAAEALVEVLTALAPVRGASLWLSSPEVRAVCAAEAGELDRRRARAGALARLAGREAAAGGPLLTVAVECWERPTGVLVVLPGDDGLAIVEELAADAAAALAVVLERESLLERGQERERVLVEASERRLARLAFDIHDGALQTVAALGLELRLLAADLAGSRGAESARVDTLRERAAVLETELRELTRSLEPTSIARRPLEATLAEQVRMFETRHDVSARLEVTGDLAGLTPSQRIALVRVAHEALANAREHGHAETIRVQVRADRHAIHLRVTDDGCGFDVARTIPAAARKGRFGLLGMSERIRLLGGRLDIESRPGGPTTVVASLPRWRGAADAARPGAAGAQAV